MECSGGGLAAQNALEGVLHVVNAESVLACEYPHDVEAQRVELRVVVGEVLFGEGAEGLLFAGGDCFQRVAEARTAAEFYFHEDEDVFLA